MQKTFTTLLALVMNVGIMFAYNGLAVNVDGIYYSLNKSKQTAAVSFFGSVPSGIYKGDIVIPGTITYNDTIYSVTSIGSSAFKYSDNLRSVVIPNSVTTIEDEAFFECKKLKSVTIPNSVIAIKQRAFYNCSFSLTSITIPNSVKSIEKEAFYGCYKLLHATIGNGVTSIGKNAFNSGLREVVCYATMPPAISHDSLSIKSNLGYPTFPSAVAIYVPCGSLDAYMASNWRFYNVQYNPKAFNTFAINVVSSDSLRGSVTSVWEYNSNCNTILTLSAISNDGYQFVRWSDGSIENPRIMVLGKDVSLSAEFDIAKSGVCGKNSQLSWKYEDQTKTLTISGSGELTENIFFGLEAPTQVQNLIIGDEVTAIGDSAFYAMTTIRHLSIGSGMTSIGNYAFAECKNFDDVTCYATTVPTITSTTFANVGNRCYIYLFVPEDCQRAYRRDTYWCGFDLRPIVEATNVETTELKVTTSDNTANVIWPAVAGASTYELIIKDKDGNIVCTIVFNANGQLSLIAFHAPTRYDAPQQTQAAGFSFTITGLEERTVYDMTLTSKDSKGSPLDQKTISFTTDGIQGIEDINAAISLHKIMQNGQLYILRDGKVYNAIGAEVK